MGKYSALPDHCDNETRQSFRLTFREINTILGFSLPSSANRPQFWANTVGKGSPIREALRGTRYETFLDSGAPRVEFRRTSN